MIIALTGFAQHGKSTVCDLLSAEFGYTSVGFADALKSMALAIDPLLPIDAMGWRNGHARMSQVHGWGGWEAVKRIPLGREFLQRLGTEGVREHLGKDAWVNAWEVSLPKDTTTVSSIDRTIVATHSDIGNVAVPDCRFLSEAARVRQLGGSIWRVVRTGHADANAGQLHASEVEQSLIEVDHTFEASTKTELEMLVRAYMLGVKA